MVEVSITPPDVETLEIRYGISIYRETTNPKIPDLIVSRDFKFGDVKNRSIEFLKKELEILGFVEKVEFRDR